MGTRDLVTKTEPEMHSSVGGWGEGRLLSLWLGASDSCGGRYRRYQGARGDDACAFQEAGGQWAMEGWGFSQILGFGGWIDPVTERPGAGKT